jgi:hypothetical protein
MLHSLAKTQRLAQRGSQTYLARMLA